MIEFAMTIEDTFTIKERGVVVTGRLLLGEAKTGRRLELVRVDGSGGIKTICRGYERTNRDPRPGEILGLLLGPEIEKDDISGYALAIDGPSDAEAAIEALRYMKLVHKALVECGNEEDAAHAWAMVELLSDNDPLPLG